MKLSNRKLQRGSQIELQMTSMIDVVFLLLIFFMTTASFVQTERDLNPAIRVHQKSRTANVDLEPAIVEVVRSGPGYVFRVGSRELTSDDELVQILRQFDNKQDGAFVRVSDEVPFQMAAAAVQACKTSGFVAVSYVPFQPPE